jgi:hypothetical protein
MRKLLKFLLAIATLGGFVLCPAGCHFLEFAPAPALPPPPQEPLVVEPGKHFHHIPPYVFLSDFELDANLPLFRELSNLREQISSELQLATTHKLIRVYLFETRAKYEKYLAEKQPDLPPNRRAFFVAPPRPLGGPEELLVYTFWSDRIQQDLRHELTHALLHSVLVDVPLWLDEGLAEYFENPQGWSGINYKHLDNLQRGTGGPFQPNLDRLEKVRKVDDMGMPEYREAWAWVHFMLRGQPQTRQVLLQYLKELRTKADPGPLRPRLQTVVATLEPALMSHLKKLDATRPAGAVAASAQGGSP